MSLRISLVPGLLLVLALAGCGTDGSGDKVATAGDGSQSASPRAGGETTSPGPGGGKMSERDRALRFSRCMRENGVPNFPDPNFNAGGGTDLSVPEGVSMEKVRAAEQKCKQFMPHGGEQPKADPEVVAQLRKYAKCMRENGVPKFPDPTDGGMQIKQDELGMTIDDPRFKAAERTCAKLHPEPRDGKTPGLSSKGEQ